ncbi:MAG TPA: TetR/AcrR family transcriptional regulator [Candidatus Paceibacterota bacterium]|nr:TetR/AcrR family transcriptional regulator [Candidatus Paceibacterota bacterium]
MAKAANNNISETREDILHAALKRFAHSGYSAASVQQIVDDAEVSKPALYYYFKDKAGLFQALVDEAHDQRYQLMQAACKGASDLRTQLSKILTAMFDHLQKNRELLRISFSTAFAAPGELPPGLRYTEKCERNFEFIHSLMKKGQADGVLDRRFDSEELAFGFYSHLNGYLASQLVVPNCALDRKRAGNIVELFFAGAAAKKRRA